MMNCSESYLEGILTPFVFYSHFRMPLSEILVEYEKEDKDNMFLMI